MESGSVERLAKNESFFRQVNERIKDVADGLEGAQTTLTDAVTRANALSTTNRQAFQAGLQVIAGDVQNELVNVGGDFDTIGDKYKDKTLNKAMSDEPSCNSGS